MADSTLSYEHSRKARQIRKAVDALDRAPVPKNSYYERHLAQFAAHYQEPDDITEATKDWIDKQIEGTNLTYEEAVWLGWLVTGGYGPERASEMIVMSRASPETIRKSVRRHVEMCIDEHRRRAGHMAPVR
jgi:hypothetical protein